MNLIIATPLYAPFIVDAQLKMAMETEQLQLDKNTVTLGVQHIFDNPLTGFYLLMLENNTPVASMLVLKEWSDWRNGEVLWIHSLYVLSEHRRKGIFKKMYAYLKEKVENETGLRGLRLYVERNNDVAQNAYKNVGMSDEHYTMFEWLAKK